MAPCDFSTTDNGIHFFTRMAINNLTVQGRNCKQCNYIPLNDIKCTPKPAPSRLRPNAPGHSNITQRKGNEKKAKADWKDTVDVNNAI